jgi:hypothetical protein
MILRTAQSSENAPTLARVDLPGEATQIIQQEYNPQSDSREHVSNHNNPCCPQSYCTIWDIKKAERKDKELIFL